MRGVVADTHTVLWYLSADPRLTVRAKAAMEAAAGDEEAIFIPTIIEKSRIESLAMMRLDLAINQPGSAFRPAPLTAEIAFRLSEVSRSSVPDLPDRVVAATALALSLPLVTCDGKIRAFGIETIW